jgi:hypothetical protein
MKDFIYSHVNNHYTHSVLGGTLTVAVANLTAPSIIDTIVLAAIGAVVSYVVSLIIKKVVEHFKK